MIAVEASDAISALDLAERLRRWSPRSTAAGGDSHEVVVERVAGSDLQEILAAITDWAGAYGLDSVGLRVGHATYRLRLDRQRGLAWRDVL